MSESDQDVSALAGLRRLVEHSRGLLRACSMEPPPESDWQYASQRWTAADIRQYVAMLLADQALTLVLDCLPSPDVVSAEDADRLRAEVHRLAVEAATHRARDEALDRLGEAERLARTDAPAAVRLLLAGDPG